MTAILTARADEFLDRFISQLSLGEPSERDGLWMFPILGGVQTARVPQVCWLTDALDECSVEVAEVNPPDVNRIEIHNQNSRLVLLFDGEELAGARQNRIVNASAVLAPGQRTSLPVSCVEQGRWAGGGQFHSEGRVYPVTLRARKHREVTRSLRRDQSYHASQQQVWADVRDMHGRLQTRSATGSMADGFQHHTRRLESDWAQDCSREQVGLLAVLAGKVLGLDVVGEAAIYHQVHRRLVQSYAIESVGRPRRPSARRSLKAAQHALAGLSGRHLTVHPGVGTGHEIRFETPSMVGSALIYGGAILHLAAFPEAD